MKQKFDNLMLFSDFVQHMDDIMSDIKRFDKNAEIWIDSSTDISETVTDAASPYGSKNYKPVDVTIGSKILYDNVCTIDGQEYIDNATALTMFWRGYHEQCHVRLRTREFLRTDASEQIIHIAKFSMCSDYLREYYKVGYHSLPEEVYCERYAFQKVSQLCNDLNFQFDWKSILTDKVNNSLFMRKHNLTYDNIETEYTHRLNSSFYEPKINIGIMQCKFTPKEISHGKSNDDSKKVHTRAFDNLMLNHSNIFRNLLCASDGESEMCILSKYVVKKEPAHLRLYQCLKKDYGKYINPVMRAGEVVDDIYRGIRGYNVSDFDCTELFERDIDSCVSTEALDNDDFDPK